MTPKEKATELYVKYYNLIESPYEKHNRTKQCALITCNEVLGYMGADRGYEFWTEVKIEIEKL